jgi:hypothetical protein
MLEKISRIISKNKRNPTAGIIYMFLKSFSLIGSFAIPSREFKNS